VAHAPEAFAMPFGREDAGLVSRVHLGRTERLNPWKPDVEHVLIVGVAAIGCMETGSAVAVV
jgi:hypothetical protein